MRIKKILNNNVIVSENEAGREIVAMGKGIAFGRKAGSEVDEAAVERIYTLSSKSIMDKFKELLGSMSSDYLKISSDIISFAEKTLGEKLHENIYVSLTDHIHMAVYRIREGIELRNMMLMETRNFYEIEFFIGQYAIEILNKKFNVKFSEDEASFIAFHIIDAQMNSSKPIASRIMKLLHELISIVRMTSHVEFDRDSIAYYRFITHLKFFAKRVFTKQESDGDIEEDMSTMIKKKYARAYRCTEKISALVRQNYGYNVSDDEEFYLTIHIAKLIGKS